TAALLAGMAAVGLLAVVTQALVAYAATLAGPARRGRVVGLVTSGVVVGILCARAVSGALADLAGWRAVYFAAAALALAFGLAAHRVLPRPAPTVSAPVASVMAGLAPAASVPTPSAPGDLGPPGRALPYRRLLGSVLVLFRREPVFRARAVLALLVFGAFSTLWSSLALPLSAPPLALSHTAIGAFGLVGVAGAVAAVPAGRLNDRGLAGWTTGVALVLLTGSWAAIALTPRSLWALAAGAVLLDLAVQAVHVTNQSLIFELQPAAGSRLIGGYMIFYSVGSGAGAIGSTAVYAFAGWLGVCALGGTLSALALLWWAATISTKKRGFQTGELPGTCCGRWRRQ
ncbi:MAG TPA: MFS transporter, partial [Pseudonocardia sp.]|nr:MFS transporter [Pseudonocardia sp.]